MNAEGISIRWKIVAMLLIVGLGAIAIIGYLGNRAGKDAIRERVSSQFTALLAAKTFQVQTYFEHIQQQVLVVSEDPTIVEAVLWMSGAYHNLNRRKIPAEWKAQLRRYYANEFVPALAATISEPVQVNAEMPATPGSAISPVFLYREQRPR